MIDKLILLTACAVLAGCTTALQVTPVLPGTAPPAMGLVYYLPYTRYDVVVTRRFVGCMPGAVSPAYTYAATPTASTHADPAKAYSVDYESLSSAFKTSDLKLTWGDNRSLTGLNASATDKTGDVIVNTITGLATLAVTAATGGAAGRAALVACEAKIQPATRQALTRRDKLDAQLKLATDRVSALTARLTALEGVASQIGQRVEGRQQAVLFSLADQLVTAKAAQEGASTATAENEKALTQTVSVRLARNGTLDEHGTQRVLLPDGIKTNDWMIPSAARGKGGFRATLVLQPVEAAVTSPPGSAEPSEAGLRYRVPTEGMLALCMAPQADGTFGEADEKPTADMQDCTKIDQVTAKPLLPIVPVPQLGRVAVLSFRNGPFQDNGVSAGFGTDGGLTTFEYKVNSASAATASDAFAKSAAALDSGIKGVAGAQTAILTAKANQVTAQNTLITANTTNLTAEQVGLLQSSTALIDAQTANLAAQQALSKQQSAGSSP